MGGEYRYVLAPGSQGNARSRSSTRSRPRPRATARTSRCRAAAATRSRRPGRSGCRCSLRARANVDYFSSIVTQQRYQQDIYRATNRQRAASAATSAATGASTSLSATAERTDYLLRRDDVPRRPASLPRITFSRGERPIRRHRRLLRRQQRVRHARTQRRPTTMCKTSDQGLTRARCQSRAADSVHALAVPHG